jgi:hypothetical protein
MVANRIMGTLFAFIGSIILGIGLLWVLGVSATSWLPDLVKTAWYTPTANPVPVGIEWFLMVLGVMLIFFGGATLRRESWALLPAVVLTTILAVFLLVFDLELLLWRLDPRPGLARPQFFEDYGYYIIGGLVLIAAIIGYGVRRLESDENRNLYAEAYAEMKSSLHICEKCGRFLIEKKCPVHDRAPLNAVLVRNDTGERFPIRADFVTMGRERSNTLVFEPSTDKNQEYKTVGRKQATIVFSDGKFFLINNNEKNPAQIDGRVPQWLPGQTHSDAVPLTDGSQVLMGQVLFTFYTDVAVLENAIAQLKAQQAAQPQMAQ